MTAYHSCISFSSIIATTGFTSGRKLDDIDDKYAVSKQVIQYHEAKESSGGLKFIITKNTAVVAGKALGEDPIDIDGILAANNLVAALILLHPIHEFLYPPPRTIQPVFHGAAL